MTKAIHPPHRPAPLAIRALEMPYDCDICGKKRSNGKHQKCSKIRQARNAQKWRD